jgi:hypothetical protein
MLPRPHHQHGPLTFGEGTAMKIMATGIDYSSGQLLGQAIDEAAFAARIQETLHRRAQEIRGVSIQTSQAMSTRYEVEQEAMVDMRDPRAAGWTFLVNRSDPQYREIIDAIRPLAEHRRMADPGAPLLYHSDADWGRWLTYNYSSNVSDQLPHYVLVVGGPEQVPFRFQALLDTAASVGRLAFDSIDQLRTYVDKLLRLEAASQPVPTQQVIFFAPDGGILHDGSYDPTYFSRRFMAQPLAGHVRSDLGFETVELFGENAEKGALLEVLRGASPALVYTASHGMAAPNQPLEVQKRVNGALCCRRTGKRRMSEWLLSGADIPPEEPFLEGGIFFQFACFGYGTPAESDFAHWLGGANLNAATDLIADIPQRLLAHPRGPVAFVGHVDTAWLHGYSNPEDPHLVESWDLRLRPFWQAVDRLLKVEPVARAMEEMNQRYASMSTYLSKIYDDLERGQPSVEPGEIIQNWIFRTDAQNYLVFGDPAARLRIAD